MLIAVGFELIDFEWLHFAQYIHLMTVSFLFVAAWQRLLVNQFVVEFAA